MHNVTYHDEEIVNDTDNIQDDEPKDEEHDTRLINAMTSSNRTKLPPGDIRRVMSKSSTRFANSLKIVLVGIKPFPPASIFLLIGVQTVVS